MLTYDCTAAAKGTDCEINDFNVSLKIINFDLCSTVIWKINNNDIIK